MTHHTGDHDDAHDTDERELKDVGNVHEEAASETAGTSLPPSEPTGDSYEERDEREGGRA